MVVKLLLYFNSYDSWASIRGFLLREKKIELHLVPLIEGFVHSCDHKTMKKLGLASVDGYEMKEAHVNVLYAIFEIVKTMSWSEANKKVTGENVILSFALMSFLHIVIIFIGFNNSSKQNQQNVREEMRSKILRDDRMVRDLPKPKARRRKVLLNSRGKEDVEMLWESKFEEVKETFPVLKFKTGKCNFFKFEGTEISAVSVVGCPVEKCPHSLKLAAKFKPAQKFSKSVIISHFKTHQKRSIEVAAQTGEMSDHSDFEASRENSSMSYSDDSD